MKKRWIFTLILIPLLVIPPAVGLTYYFIQNKSPTASNSNPSKSFDEVKTDVLTSIGLNERKVLKRYTKPTNNNVYQTELWTKYHKDYNFTYPGYDRNYEVGDNKYFQNASGNRINFMPLVYNERVPGTNGKKYSDGEWIQQEISNNSLKKHPAATTFYKNDVSNIQVEQTHFTLSTSITGPYTTGLYARPGEVITLTFDDDTWQDIKNQWDGLQIIINNSFWDNYEEGNQGQTSNRYPFIRSFFDMNNKEKTIKFGTPFGGEITVRLNRSLKSQKYLPTYDAPNVPIGFTIDGAIPTMYYQDGVTTPENWELQKKLVIEQKLAPVIQGTSSYFSFSLPFTDLNVAGHTEVDKLKYPIENFRKWNYFLFLSNYYNSRDVKHNVLKLDMQFCDDIWGNAYAWGGGNKLHCPTELGIESFFNNKLIEIFNPKDLWGMFHEINHNFQENGAFFRKNTHPETNQTSVFNLSVMSDFSRLRTTLNYSGQPNSDNNNPDWARLTLPYISIYDLKNKKKNGNFNTDDEYPVYSQLLYLLGPKNYVDYVRWDTMNHPSSASSWTGIDEIKTLSEYFKINLFPALFDYSWYWSDWTLENNLNFNEKKVVDEVANKYKAIDFITNHFATGSYLYNSVDNEYRYTGDITTPFEIVAGKPFVFDLDKFIISMNDNFTWTELKFPEITSTGAKLDFDKNTKKLTYIPSSNIDQVDEFDISIIPDNFKNKPKNYVEQIRWKIKIRQVINQPFFELYNFDDANLREQELLDQLDTIEQNKQPVITHPLAIFDTNMFIENYKQGVKIKFYFQAPKTGTYEFKNRWSHAIKIKLNNEVVYTSDKKQNSLKPTFSRYLKKDQIISFEISQVGKKNNRGYNDFFDMEANVDKQEIDIIANSVIPDYKNFTNESITNIINNINYKHINRVVDRNIFNDDILNDINLSDYQTEYIPLKRKDDDGNEIDTYSLSSEYHNVENLNTLENGKYFELWNEDHATGQTRSSFEIKFIKPEKVSGLLFGHRTDNHYNSRATNIKVIGYNDENMNGVTLYDGKYGEQFNDRSSPSSFLNFNQTIIVDSLKVEAYNTIPNYYQKTTGLIWHWLRILPNKYSSIKSLMGVNNESLKYVGNWEFRNNDDENISSVNNIYTKSTNSNDSLHFLLKNSQGFNIIGKKTNIPTKINVFVNGIKINESPLTISSNTNLTNTVLFSYFTNNNGQDLNIQIQHLDNNPLYLNFITIF